MEQICTISAIDGDFDPMSMVMTPSGRLAVRRINRMMAIPPSLTHAGLKYISSVLASNAPAAAQRWPTSPAGGPSNLEARLLDELSNLEPELKVNLQFPASAAIFEGNWRALTRTGATKPLFLDMMHRNLIGGRLLERGNRGPPRRRLRLYRRSAMASARPMLRTRLGDIATRETARNGSSDPACFSLKAMRRSTASPKGCGRTMFPSESTCRRDDDVG